MIRTGKPADSLPMGEVYCAAWKQAYAGIVPDAFLERLTPEMAAPPAERIGPDNSLVWDENGVIALVNFGPERGGDMAEIRSIYVHPDHWRRGIGAKLFGEALGALKKAGYANVCLWVLTENARARRFYERMGMRLAGEHTIEIAGKPLSESRYEMDI